MRRLFEMPEADREHLDARGKPWETINDGGGRWLLVHDFAVPPGYNHALVTVALRIEPTYPDTQIDMAYFAEHLSRQDGKRVNALSMQTIDGKQYQRWSRHRAGANHWRPGIDGVSTHLALVYDWLESELQKGC